MKEGFRDFDKEAAVWDVEPRRVDLARQVAKSILEGAATGPETEAADFGCGTGLVTLFLQPHVRRITGMDASAGMLKVLREKGEKAGWTNLETLQVDLEHPVFPPGRFHLLVSSMALHHVKDIDPLLARFHECLIPGGAVALADLDLEGGAFHPDPTGVFHNGFDRSDFKRRLEKAGFQDVQVRDAARTVKPLRDGTERAFTVFLATGRK